MPTIQDCQVTDGPGEQWWLSDAIVVKPPPEDADPVSSLKFGTEYVWHLAVSPFGMEKWDPAYGGFIAGEVWAGKPATVFTPDNLEQLGGAAVGNFTGTTGSAKIVSGTSWSLGDKLKDAANGHVCLIGRIYHSASATPPPQPPPALGFDAKSSQHVAQCNFSVVTAINKQLLFDMYIAMPKGSAPGPVNVRVYEDRSPSRAIVQKLGVARTGRAVFRRVASGPAVRFGLEMGTDLRPAVTDGTQRSGLSRLLHAFRPGDFRARVTIPDTRSHKVTVRADLSRSRSGDAHLFHVVQTGMDGRPHGGVTVAAICP